MKVLFYDEIINKGFVILSEDDGDKLTACQWVEGCARADSDCEKCGWSNNTRKMTRKQAVEYWKNKSF